MSNSKGIPQKLDTRIRRLASLLDNLPSHLPTKVPKDAYIFGVDTADVDEEGFAYALNRSLEVTFQTHLNPKITLNQRGPCFKVLITLFRRATKELAPNERDNVDGILWRWLERLILTAEQAGAKVVKQVHKRHLVESSSEDESLQGALLFKPVRRPVQHPVVVEISSNSDSGELTDQDFSLQPIVIPATEAISDLPASTQPLTAAPPATAKRLRDIATSDGSDIEEQPAQRQRTLFDLGCKRVSKEEAQAQQRRVTEMLGVDREKLRAEGEAREEQWKEHKRELARLRQQKCRANKRATGGRQEQKAKRALLGYDMGSSLSTAPKLNDFASLSRSDSSSWRELRNGSKGGVVKKNPSRINWFQPFLFSFIDRIAPRVSFSPTMIVKHLHRTHPELYQRLRKNVVARWISKRKNSWSKVAKAKIAAGRNLKGTGQVGVLTPYPEIVEEVKTLLDKLRRTGITIDRMLGRSLLISVIEKRQPQILTNENFKCSEKYVGHFYESIMKWSLRCGTRPSAKFPDNAMEQIERTFFRIVHLTILYDIPPELVINMDQTGVILLMSKKRTFAPTNSKQVDISHHDEKRAFTLCVASMPAGLILPFQVIWAGKSIGSLPTIDAPGYDEAIEEGFDFTFADSPKKNSHFSTLKTMKDWIQNILKPYINNYVEVNRERLQLPDDQKAILLIDCYPVHIGLDFRTHVFTEYPNIFLLFVPAGCTGVFQPADLVLNRVIKHFLRQETLKFLVDSHSKQLQEGLDPKNVRSTTSLPVLRNGTVQPLVNLYNYLRSYSGCQLVKRAWEKCTVGEWNLSAECLTSPRTKVAYRRYLEKDSILRKEIEAKLGREAMINTQLAPEEVNGDAYPPDDSTEIPLGAVVEEVTGDAPDTANELIFHNTFCVDNSDFSHESDGSFDVTSTLESVWAYTKDGRTWSEYLGDIPNDK